MRVDPDQIEQTLLSLVRNAVDATLEAPRDGARDDERLV